MFKLIKLSNIIESKSNPRSYFSEEALNELATSIQLLGVLQPIIVRPMKGTPCFELVSGARRYRSAVIAKLDEIPANVKELTDEEVLEIQITENLQRENVNPMDEAVAFSLMKVASKLSVETIASRTGKNINFVKGRLKLNDLIDDAKVLVYSNILPVVHATKIAMLSEKRQKEALKFVSVINSDKQTIAVKAIHELNHWMQHNIVKPLDKAPFDIKSNKLLPDVASCLDCPKTTCENKSLFAEFEDNNCLDIVCYQAKTQAYIQSRKTAIEKKYKQDVVLVSDVYWNAPEGILNQSDYEEKTVASKCENCKLAMIAHSTSGKEGQELYLCVKAECKNKDTAEGATSIDIEKNKKLAIKNHANTIAISMTDSKIDIDTFDRNVLKTMFFLNLFIHLDSEIMKHIVEQLNWEYLNTENEPCIIEETVTPLNMFIDNFRGLPEEISIIEKYVALENIKAWISNPDTQEIENDFKQYYEENIMSVVKELAKQNEKLAKKLAEFYSEPTTNKLKGFSVDEMKFIYKTSYSLTQLAKKLGVSLNELGESPNYEEIFNLLKQSK